MSEMGVKVGHLPDPYQLDIAYAGGQPIGAVEKFVMDVPTSDHLGPHIRQALREGFTVRLREQGPRGGETPGC